MVDGLVVVGSVVLLDVSLGGVVVTFGGVVVVTDGLVVDRGGVVVFGGVVVVVGFGSGGTGQLHHGNFTVALALAVPIDAVTRTLLYCQYGGCSRSSPPPGRSFNRTRK